MSRYVYSFGAGRADGSAKMKNVLGGKGANLAEMTNLGIPVPPGFTISAELCNAYIANQTYPPELKGEVQAALKKVEAVMGRTFGAATKPLLVSVRSGAAVSMPGMMDTILNLGMNDAVAAALAQETGNPQFAYDAYRRFVQMYGDVVLGLKGSRSPFEPLLAAKKKAKKVERDIDLPAEDLRALVGEYKAALKKLLPSGFPEEPEAQLWGAIEAVWRSWMGDRAVAYRRIHHVPETLGTAVSVMAMVFGNFGEDSGTGVAFTRDPSTGEKRFFGEFLVNAQGEDVVAGIRTPEPVELMAKKFPPAYQQLVDTYQRLEKHYRDMQDLEFTVERGKLFLLQTRNGKRTGAAAVRVAVDMVGEKMLTEQEALLRVSPDALDQLLHPMVDPAAPCTVLATGLPASPGAAAGQVVFEAHEAFDWAKDGKAVVLVRAETSPEDIKGMAAAKGILTARGGMTSHAAVVARGMGKCCVVGAKAVEVDEAAGVFRANGRTVKRGDWVTLDGSTGRVIDGQVKLVEPKLSGQFAQFMQWADRERTIKVRTNADTPLDARRAREFGAEGIGLCRTEHMFFEGDRIAAMREMIVARDVAGRRKALAKLLPMQREDFEGIFTAMDGYPVTIRLLDPPLHEFLPHEPELVAALAKQMGISAAELTATVESLREANPMLGHRGCRLGITYPEITEMQAQAIFEAAVNVAAKGVKVMPEVMVPLVAVVAELKNQVDIVRRVAAEVFAKAKREVPYLAGTMIELPRAALTADEIAQVAEFFSYGTNDLTQTTFGLSRDDAGRFLPAYVEAGILENDPFQVLDQQGVGKLVRLGIELGRSVRKDLKVGICGEHGGEPSSVMFCHDVGMNYVSCSPFRVPIARLAAAQAALKAKGAEDRTGATV
ncbi:MAG TPA: pyruvate, phosphate dikinase [Gemmatimonadales bacterium]|nr:pyruvate, phosphate dikinase [Gemmatimonadales bacterium]